MNKTFINSTSSNQMWTQQTTSGTPTNNCADNLSNQFGLALGVSGTGTSLKLSHSGENTDHGFCSLLFLHPNRKSGIVLLTNKANRNGALSDIQQALENTLLCPVNRDFTSQITSASNWIYEAQTIQASNTFAAGVGEIVFDGATEIVLKPGFHAQAGIIFRAIIDGCLGSINPY